MKFSLKPILLGIITGFIVTSCTIDESDDGPDVDPRTKFLGEWSVNDETCNKGRYMVAISVDPSNSSQVLIYNFGFSQAADPDTAIVAGSTVTLPSQVNSEKWGISGIGKYQDPDRIEWTYSLFISGDLQSCTATYVRP